MEYYLALQKKKILSFVTAWMNLEDHVKISSTQRDDLASTWKLKTSDSEEQRAEGPFLQRWKVKLV